MQCHSKLNRIDCRSYKPWMPASDAFAEAFFGEREPHLNEFWVMSGTVA
jgi:hypothetical protein